MRRKQKGITLIALVITVIVLLILAGVSITAAIGDHDKAIISKARESAEQTEISAKGEDGVVKEILNKIDDTSTTDKFTVTFIDGDNNVLATVTGQTGTTISYPSNAGTPTKANTAGAKYTFANKWATDPEGTNVVNLSSITSSDRLYAVFNEEKIYYTVTFSYMTSTGTSTTTNVSVVGGQTLTDANKPTPSEYTANNYTYTFSKWVESDGSTKATFSNITSNKTVKAIYTSEYVCFVAGTKVLTEVGLVNIEDIKPGMKVYSKNELTGEVELKEVKETFINYVDYDMTKVTVNGEVIESTDGHDYYEVAKGWIDACELEVGDKILNNNNEEVIVEKVETIKHEGDKLTTVYNFEVVDNHNYYVGESSVLVHNVPSPGGSSTDSPTAGDSCSSGTASPEEGMISPG